MKPFIALFTVALALGAVGARADTPETQQKHLDEYAPYLQPPVDQFHFWNFDRWQIVGADKVVVWATVRDAYLITVQQPCTSLAFADRVGVTSQQSHIVSQRFDFITFKNERCQIEQIQPIDYDRMRKERAAAG